MTHSAPGSLAATFRFAMAGTLSALMAALSLSLVIAKNGTFRRRTGRTQGFLADKKRALNFYKVFSAAYDIVNPPFYTEQMRSQITNLLNGYGLRVLDVGCGTGYTTQGLSQRQVVAEVVSLDMNPAQLEHAKKKLSTDPKVRFFRGDAENLPFQNNEFDAVVSVGAVEYFPNPQKPVNEMARVVKPGGIVVVGGPENRWFSKLGLNRFFYTPSRKKKLQNSSPPLDLRKRKPF